MGDWIVRAVDVGFGHVKFTEGRKGRGKIELGHFPSQSTIVMKGDIGVDSEALHKLDVFLIPIQIGDRVDNFVVGRDIDSLLSSDSETTILDQDYCLSPAYMARLFGALSYMYRSLPADDQPARTIDMLALGLPMHTYKQYKDALVKKYTGTFVINDRGHAVTIKHCTVYPQPLGSYATFVGERGFPEPPQVLVIDPGFNTLDWFTCKGMKVQKEFIGAVELGVSQVIRAIANKLPHDIRKGASIAAISRILDESFSSGVKQFKLRGKAYDIEPHMAPGKVIIDQAVGAVKAAMKDAVRVDHIVVTGGGASLFLPTIQARFPDHDVVLLDNPAFSNVRGFQVLAENLATSMARASAGASR